MSGPYRLLTRVDEGAAACKSGCDGLTTNKTSTFSSTARTASWQQSLTASTRRPQRRPRPRRPTRLRLHLLSHALKRCDEDGLPAYLEATSPLNRALYARHGFEDMGVIQGRWLASDVADAAEAVAGVSGLGLLLIDAPPAVRPTHICGTRRPRSPVTSGPHGGGVRILAHRGSPTPGTTENTVSAVTAALLAGADGVEVDLRLSADGVLVVCHDADLRRVAAHPLRVAETPWQVLHAAADARGVPLARTEWVLAAAAGRPVVLELKAPPPAPRARARTVYALVDRLGRLHSVGLPMDVTVSSFDASLASLARAELPVELQVRTALLGRPGVRASALLRQALAAGHDQMHPHVLEVLAAPKTVAAARALGLEVVPWTVNGRRALRRCSELGVDAVITDVPETARLAFAGRTPA